MSAGYTQRQKEVLDFFCAQRNAIERGAVPVEWFTLADVNEFVNKSFPWHGPRPPQGTARTLASLIRAGVIERCRERGRVFYRWCYTASPGVGS